MVAGVLTGYLLRRHKLKKIGLAITFFIWLLLFLLGVEVGGNEKIVSSIPTLGLEAIIISLVSVLGSCLAAYGLWTYIQRHRKEKDNC